MAVCFVLLMTLALPVQHIQAAGTVYTDSTTLAMIYDQSDCYSMQGFGIYGSYLYCVKANTTSNGNACVARIHKDTGATTYMTNSATGTKYFTYLGHANDLDIVNVGGSGAMFVTTGSPGSGSLVRMTVSGTTLKKYGSYNVTYNGSQVSYGGVSVVHVDSQYVTLMFKTGSSFFTGKVGVNQTSGTIVLTKLFNINKTDINFGGVSRDLSAWFDQGFEYYDNKVFVPLTGNHVVETIATSAIAVYNIEGASGTIKNDPTYSFWLESSDYPGLFEIEGLALCAYDGKMYFATNSRLSSSATNYDAVHVMDSFVYEPDKRPSKVGNYRWEFVDNALTPVLADGNSYNGVIMHAGSVSGEAVTSAQYCISEPVVLMHDRNWILEWKGSGVSNNNMFFSTESSSNLSDHYYLFRSTKNSLIALGYLSSSTGKNYNYGVSLDTHGIDGTTEHTYRLTNKVNSDGSNMVYLSVDGVELGAMNNYYIGLTSQNSTSNWVSGKDFYFSYMGTYEYKINNCSLSYIQVWGDGLQHQEDEPDTYRWETTNNTFAPVSAAGLTVNNPTVLHGTCTNNVFSGSQFQLSRDVVLSHDRPWVMEWQSEGNFTGGAMLLAAHERSNAKNAPFLFRYSGSSLLAFGSYTGSEHSNYGLNLADYGIDATASHVYRLTNKINTDGSNMVYLSVDGVEIAPMNQYFSGITAKNTTSNWISGKDFTFTYMGTWQNKINDGSIGYFQIWENGIPADHVSTNYRWETKNNTLTSITTNGFTKNDVSTITGSVSGATITKGSFRMDKSVTLCHDKSWTISWQADAISGTNHGADMLLASSNYNNEPNSVYVLRSWDGDFLAIGTRRTSHHNYGLKLSDYGIDPAAAHTFMLTNRVAADGSNMVYLYVDGKEVGPMNNHYVGLNTQNETVDWVSGKDFTFTFIGTYNYPIKNYGISYLQINENCSHSFGAWVEKAATCTAAGSKTRSCSLCGYTETQSIAATGHSYKAVVTAPTCTAEGYTTYTCSKCNHSYTSDKVAAIGHSYKSVVTAPTCTEGGYTTYTCSKCSHSYQGDEVAAIGHSYKSVVTAPTCTKDGYTTHTCTFCGNNYVDSYVKSTGHSYKAVVTAPTCTAEGYTTYTCTKCNNSYTSDSVAATGHSYVDGKCGNCGESDPGYVAPSAPYALVGEMNDWDETAAVMTGDGTVSVTMTLEKGSYQFKIRQGDTWYGNDGIIVNTTTTTSDVGWLMSTTAGNCTLSASGGEYTFTFDPKTQMLIVTCSTNETEVDPVPTGVITLKNVSLSLEDEIHYNIYFETTDVNASEENMGLIIWDSEPAVPTINGGGTVIEGATYVPTSGQYGISSMGVPAKNMADLKYMVVYAKQSDGSYVYSKVLTYSAKTYCLSRVKNSSNEKMRALCVALMNYGAAAQEYFASTDDYTCTELMNVGFEAYQDLVKPYDATLLNSRTPVDPAKAGSFGTSMNGFTGRSASMSADGSFALNYYFTTSVAVDKVTFYYWTEAKYNSVSELTPENASGSMEMTATGSGNTFWANYAGIAAKDMDKSVFACGVYEKDGVTYSTGVISYSLAQYCISKAAAGTEFSPLAAATAVYGYHAKTYFAS